MQLSFRFLYLSAFDFKIVPRDVCRGVITITIRRYQVGAGVQLV